MIEMLNVLDATVNCVDYNGYTHNVAEGNIIHKINVLIKAVNEIKQYLDWDGISGAENRECAKNAHKSDLEEALEGFPGLFKSNKDEPLVDAVMRDVKRINQKINFEQPEVKENHKIRSTNERLRKALDLAIDWLKQVATPEKCDDKLCCEFTKRKLEQIESIKKGVK